MLHRSPLDDPGIAAHAWARYKRLMRWMFGFTLAVVIAALALLYSQTGMVSVHFYIATGLGIGFAMLLMSALMGLVFLSSGTGHDEALADNEADDQAEDGRSR
jgi:heme/copper-type cytochrome/quinol oxidase subunit 4